MTNIVFQWAVLSVLLVVVFSNRTSVESLYKNLLSVYNPYVRPNEDQSRRTVISVTVHLISINEIDELLGAMSSVFYVDMMWKDSRMTWNKTEYSDVTNILFPQKLVWKPDLVVTNAVNRLRKIGFQDIMIRYNDNGMAYWYTGDYLETSCDIDVTHFPFDRQVCTIEMIPWNYRLHELQLFIAQNNVRLKNFTENGEWILYETAAERVGDGPFEYIYFKLYLERRSSFFIINLFIPVVLLVFLNCMVFLLSPDSGERVGYAITCLLSITVYLTLVSETLPRTSKPICILSIVLLMLLILSTIICFLTIISLRFHFRSEQKPLPKWLARLTRALRCTRTNTKRRCQYNVKSSIRKRKETSTDGRQRPSESNTTHIPEDSDQEKQNVSNMESGNEPNGTIQIQSVHLEEPSRNCQQVSDDNSETWQTFAKVFDQYCFLFCCVVLVIGAMYFGISSLLLP